MCECRVAQKFLVVDLRNNINNKTFIVLKFTENMFMYKLPQNK